MCKNSLDGSVEPKHVGVIKTSTVVYIVCAFGGFIERINDFNVVNLPCGSQKWKFRQDILSINFVCVSVLSTC